MLIGTVADRGSGAALADAVVRLRGGTAQDVVTDSGGRFATSDLRPGQYAVLVTRIGYSPLHDSVRLAQGALDTVRYTLQYYSCP